MNQQDLNNAIKEGIALKKEANKLIDEANLKTAQEISNFKKTNQAYVQIVKRLKEVNTEVKEAKDAQRELVGQYVQQEAKLKGLTGLQASLSGLEGKRLQKMANMGKLDEAKRKTFDTIASLQNDLLNTSSEDVIAQADIKRQLDEQYKDLEGARGVHSHIAKNLRQQRQIAEGISSMTEKQQKFLNKQLEVYDGIKDTIGGILETADLLLSTGFGKLGAVLIGAGAAGKKLLDTSYQLGGSLLDTSNIATTLFGTVFEDAVGTTKGLAQEFGGLSDVSLTTQYRTNVLAKNLGIGADSAAKLTGSFARLNDGSAETAQNLIQSTKNLAEANGLVPSAVMADVANSAEEFALYGKAGGTNIAEAAVAAGKLGVSMKTLSGITDNLLDFESSINAELELGAMLGRNINLDRARALAYEGDIGGSVRETLSALGGIEEFNRMDYFQKKQTAALLGVSVEEFQKMAANADKLGKNGEIIPTQYEAALNTMKAFGSQLFSGVQTLGSMAVAAGQMGIKVGDIAGGMKNFAVNSATALGNIIKMGAQKIFGSGAGKAIGGLGEKLGAAGGKMKDKIGGLFQSKTGPSASPISEGANPAKKGGMMDSMSKINMSAVLKGAAAMLVVAGAVFVFGKAVQEFMKVSWEAVGMAVVSMLALVGAVALLGAIMMSGVGAVAILAGAAAMLVIAASVLVLGYALQAIGTGFEMMATGISTLLPQLMSVATTIGGLVLLIPAIGLLSLSMMGLSASLVALGVAGIAALPGLMAVAAVGTIAMGVGSLLGFGEGGEGGGEGDTALLDEIRGLREDLNNGKVAVYLDGQKVTAGVSRVVSRVGSNSYAT